MGPSDARGKTGFRNLGPRNPGTANLARLLPAGPTAARSAVRLLRRRHPAPCNGSVRPIRAEGLKRLCSLVRFRMPKSSSQATDPRAVD